MPAAAEGNSQQLHERAADTAGLVRVGVVVFEGADY